MLKTQIKSPQLVAAGNDEAGNFVQYSAESSPGQQAKHFRKPYADLTLTERALEDAHEFEVRPCEICLAKRALALRRDGRRVQSWVADIKANPGQLAAARKAVALAHERERNEEVLMFVQLKNAVSPVSGRCEAWFGID